MRPKIHAAAVLAAVLTVAVLFGPRAPVVETWSEPDVGGDPTAYLEEAESRVPGVRPGAEKAVEWAESVHPARTPLAVVYLHGYSADRHELDPVPGRVAERLGANVYFARLTGHGRDGDAMAEATVQRWFQDVAEAMAVAERLGERTVLIGTSTGGTLAVWAAAQEAWRDRIAAVVLVSPNFGLRDRRAGMLLWPWGNVIVRLVVGPERCFEPENPAQAEHWTVCYPSRALLPMMALVEHVRAMELADVTAPALVLYSTEDQVVDPARTQSVFGRLGGTPKRLLELTGSGDPAHHVLAGDIISPGLNHRVIDEIVAFVESLSAQGEEP